MVDIETDAPALLPGHVTADALDEIENFVNAGVMEVVEPRKGQRVIVEVYIPHIAEYGHNPSLGLVYGWPGGPLEVGDLVLCPGTALQPGGWTGIVTSLDASGHPYKGRVRMLLGRKEPSHD